MENIDHEKKLKITIYKDVKNICRETAKNIDMGMDKAASDLISELIWKKTKRIAEDLELFAKHAKRTTVNADDIKLLARHNEKLISEVAASGIFAKSRELNRSEQYDQFLGQMQVAGYKDTTGRSHDPQIPST